MTPALNIGIAKSGSNLVHSPPSHILCLMPCVKARKSFQGVLPCLVMMYHQTNLDCKSFSISEDLVEKIVALTLNFAKWYFWMILWLMMMHHHTRPIRDVVPANIHWSSWPWPWTETFNLGLEHSNPAFSLDTSLLMMIYTQIEFGCKRLTGLELIKDIVETVIFWLYRPTQWPWPWR